MTTLGQNLLPAAPTYSYSVLQFLEEETEAQRSQADSPGSHSLECHSWNSNSYLSDVLHYPWVPPKPGYTFANYKADYDLVITIWDAGQPHMAFSYFTWAGLGFQGQPTQ